MQLCGGFVGCMPGRMLVNPGDIGLALDAQVVLRWRFLFPAFLWPVGRALASAEIFRGARDELRPHSEERPSGRVSKDDDSECPMVRDARQDALLTMREKKG
jgi:hypothetical protein